MSKRAVVKYSNAIRQISVRKTLQEIRGLRASSMSVYDRVIRELDKHLVT